MEMKRRTAASKSILITLSDQAKEGKRILLKVQGQKKVENFCYWMGRKTPLYELMLDYTERIGVQFNSVRLLYDGSPIHPFSTPHLLKMEDGEIIDVMRWDNLVVKGATQWPLISLPLVKEDELPIFLKVQQGRDEKIFYRMGRHTRLHNLMIDFCLRSGSVYDCMGFSFQGSKVQPDKTADDLQMKDGDAIEAVHMLSG